MQLPGRCQIRSVSDPAELDLSDRDQELFDSLVDDVFANPNKFRPRPTLDTVAVSYSGDQQQQDPIQSLTNSKDQKRPWDGLKPGFYYHYKHDSKQGVDDHAYFVSGIGHHTEGDFVKDTFVLYQPLYKSAPTFQAGPHHYDTRPLDKFLEPVKPGMPRFTQITDKQIQKELEAIQKALRA